jgi:hypothetical protein
MNTAIDMKAERQGVWPDSKDNKDYMSPSPRRSSRLKFGLIAICVGAVITIYFFYPLKSTTAGQNNLAAAWYSDDDGKTWFAGDQHKVIPPFDHNGKTAYRAYLFSSNGGKDAFVGYLERYTPEGAKMLADLRSPKPNQPPMPGILAAIQTRGLEVKKPGEAIWVNAHDIKAAAVRSVPNAKPLPVLP